MNYKYLDTVFNYASNAYDESNCKYNGGNYIHHIFMVKDFFTKYSDIFTNPDNKTIVYAAIFCHDLMEDAKQSWNDISKITGKDAANIVLCVTDVPAENRLMKHLLTMGKTVKDYRAIIVKMCDMAANATYSQKSGSSMYNKYVEEYNYRRPIFKQALKWYKNDINQSILNEMWDELDKIHNFISINNE